MKRTILALVSVGALAVPGVSRAADEDQGWTGDEVPPLAAADERAQATPPSAAPSTPAPPPPAERPPPPQPEEQRGAGNTQGQWVYTQQYGWVWMPYADDFLYFPSYGPPYAYLYYPLYGWTWVIAPWIYGWGPWPYFGFYGAVHYGWYGHGWWREPWRWRSYPPAGWGPPPAIPWQRGRSTSTPRPNWPNGSSAKSLPVPPGLPAVVSSFAVAESPCSPTLGCASTCCGGWDATYPSNCGTAANVKWMTVCAR